jgi:hypothetical protein
MYAYKPSIGGIMGKMLSLEDLLTLTYGEPQKVSAYINEHRTMAQVLALDPSTLRPVLEGATTAEPSLRELLQAHLANNKYLSNVSIIVNEYFEAINHCMRSTPKLSPFGKPPTEDQKQAFLERHSPVDDNSAPYGVLVRHEGSPDTLFVVAGFEVATVLAKQYECARVIPVSQP